MSPARTDPPLRLRPLVELLDAPDGSLYLLQGPAGGDCVIRAPSREVRAVVEAMRQGGSETQLAHRCAARGVDASIEAVREVATALKAADMLEPAASGEPLEPGDAERFDRQLLYLRQQAAGHQSGAGLQRKLRASRVAILGCGGLGSWVAWTLATIGVGELVLVDPDAVDLSNLNRQVLFDIDDIGRGKAESAGRRLRSFDPRLAVTAVSDRIESPRDVAALVRGADLAVACADTPAYEIGRWINDGCAAEGVPHISAGQMPPAVRVGPFVQPGVTACVHCLERHSRRDSPLAGALEAMRRADLRPAATLGPACALIGSLIGLDALHWLTGLGRPATWGAVLTMDIRTLTFELEPVPRDARCTCRAVSV